MIDIVDKIASSPVVDVHPVAVDQLYVMQASSGLIKIGRSNDPARRRVEFERASGHPIVIIVSLPGRAHAEISIHRKLSRHRGIGEWFVNTPESRRDICAAIGVDMVFRFSGMTGLRRTRNPERAKALPWRRGEAHPDVAAYAEKLLGHAIPSDWEEAHDAEERMLDGLCTLVDVNAIRERLRLPLL